MTTKQWMLILLTITLGAFSLYFNRDWFAKDSIQIYHRCRPARYGRDISPDGSDVQSVLFGFDRQLKLTCIKMIPLDALKTNKYARPVWELVSDSNSVPMKSFYYGEHIRGMHPAISGVQAEALDTDVTYRMFITAGSVKGQHDFELKSAN